MFYPIQAMLNQMRNTGPEMLETANIILETIEPTQNIFESRTVNYLTRLVVDKYIYCNHMNTIYGTTVA